jgi:hypothetical protein
MQLFPNRVIWCESYRSHAEAAKMLQLFGWPHFLEMHILVNISGNLEEVIA